MRYVSQKHVNGCGVAALAMATGNGYDKTLKVIAPHRKTGSIYPGTALEHALKALTKMKLDYRIIFNHIDVRRLKNTAYISVTQSCGCRHAVTWDPQEQRVLDPGLSPDHTGKTITIDYKYVKKHMNFIVEIIPS